MPFRVPAFPKAFALFIAFVGRMFYIRDKKKFTPKSIGNCNFFRWNEKNLKNRPQKIGAPSFLWYNQSWNKRKGATMAIIAQKSYLSFIKSKVENIKTVWVERNWVFRRFRTVWISFESSSWWGPDGKVRKWTRHRSEWLSRKSYVECADCRCRFSTSQYRILKARVASERSAAAAMWSCPDVLNKGIDPLKEAKSVPKSWNFIPLF